MARTVLNDNTWEQLQSTMKAHGCHTWKNDRQVMEAILWKLRTGAPWREYRVSYVHGKPPIIALTGCQKKAYGSNFF